MQGEQSAKTESMNPLKPNTGNRWLDVILRVLIVILGTLLAPIWMPAAICVVILFFIISFVVWMVEPCVFYIIKGEWKHEIFKEW